jgi:hypothetical protein
MVRVIQVMLYRICPLLHSSSLCNSPLIILLWSMCSVLSLCCGISLYSCSLILLHDDCVSTWAVWVSLCLEPRAGQRFHWPLKFADLSFHFLPGLLCLRQHSLLSYALPSRPRLNVSWLTREWRLSEPLGCNVCMNFKWFPRTYLSDFPGMKTWTRS